MSNIKGRKISLIIVLFAIIIIIAFFFLEGYFNAQEQRQVSLVWKVHTFLVFNRKVPESNVDIEKILAKYNNNLKEKFWYAKPEYKYRVVLRQDRDV